METIKRILVKAILTVTICTVILFTSTLMYISLNQTLIHDDISRPVYVTSSTCNTNTGDGVIPCQRGKGFLKSKLVPGEEYTFHLVMNVPESAQNQNDDIFDLCIELVDVSGTMLFRSCRMIMLPYQTNWIRRIYKIINSPLYVFRLKEESKTLVYDVLSKYEGNKINHALIEIHSNKFRHYSIHLRVAPQYSGMKYMMLHWPTLSSIIGIWFICCMLTIALLLLFVLINCGLRCLTAMIDHNNE